MQVDVLLFLLRRWTVNLLLFAMALLSEQGHSQNTPSPPGPAPNAPRPTITNRSYPYAGFFCAFGSSLSSMETRATAGFGAGLSLIPLPVPVYTEVGVMGPQANRSSGSAYVSVDASLPLASSRVHVLPLAFAGYSRFFETGHALDYGVALVLPRPWRREKDMRLELRDYLTFAAPTQHNVMLRLGLITFMRD